MLAAFLAGVLTLQAEQRQAQQHRDHKCCCGEVVVTSWIGIVEGPDDAWGGMRPRMRFTPDHIEYRQCSYAAGRHRP